MNFIKKIVDKKTDESIHLQFQKFSKGEFRDRALIKAKSSAGKYTINTTYEFANDLVKFMADRLGTSKSAVKGVVVYTGELDGIDYKDKKQFMGVKQYVLDEEMPGTGILDMMSKFPKAFFALSFRVGEDELKIKAKAPKSAKPKTKGGDEIVADFCKLVTRDRKIAQDFIFEKTDFKTAEVKHDFIIEEIVVPQDLKGEKDRCESKIPSGTKSQEKEFDAFAIIRELAKRKGKIIRTSTIDGEKIKKEIGFEA